MRSRDRGPGVPGIAVMLAGREFGLPVERERGVWQVTW
jgi:hypothetical protein